MKDNIIHCC